MSAFAARRRALGSLHAAEPVWQGTAGQFRRSQVHCWCRPSQEIPVDARDDRSREIGRYRIWCQCLASIVSAPPIQTRSATCHTRILIISSISSLHLQARIDSAARTIRATDSPTNRLHPNAAVVKRATARRCGCVRTGQGIDPNSTFERVIRPYALHDQHSALHFVTAFGVHQH